MSEDQEKPSISPKSHEAATERSDAPEEARKAPDSTPVTAEESAVSPAEIPRTDVPRTDVPQEDASKTETSRSDTSQADVSQVDTSEPAAPSSPSQPAGQQAETEVATEQPNEVAVSPKDSPDEEPVASPAVAPEAPNASSADDSAPDDSAPDDSQEATNGAETEEKSAPVGPDYQIYTKEELAVALETLLKEGDIPRAEAEAQRMRPHFDALLDTEREVARQKYVAEGGEEEGFEFRPDFTYERFLVAYQQVRSKKKALAKEQRKQRQQNLEVKQDILDRLRALVDSEETQASLEQLRVLQQEWRDSGPVPPAGSRNLWANYHALLDRFYDQRSIYFELKELDRRKNLEAKQAVAERTEALVDESDLRKAVAELDELHEEYKHLGPVPKEEQEPLWQRFKAASDQIHDRRRAEVEKFKGELNENLTKKQQLVAEAQELSTFSSDSIKEWNQKTKRVQELKQRWEAIGSMPRKQAKSVNRDFWGHFKQFFAHKGEFFKQLDAERSENLAQKEALVARAESLKESDDWKTTSQEFKDLQQQWRAIGPVPEKKREDVYRRFKAAADHFFNRRRGESKEQQAEQVRNQQQKEAICQQIEELAEVDKAKQEDLLALTDRYAEVGFVPREAMQPLQKRFDKAVRTVMKRLKLSDRQKQRVVAEVELSSLKASPGADRKIDKRENQLRRQISQMEDDIALWSNNISFFAASKGADKLKADFEKRIAEAQREVDDLKSQLSALQDIR